MKRMHSFHWLLIYELQSVVFIFLIFGDRGEAIQLDQATTSKCSNAFTSEYCISGLYPIYKCPGYWHYCSCLTNYYYFQIPKLKPHKPVPVTTYKEPDEQNIMAQIRERNRRKAEVSPMESLLSWSHYWCNSPYMCPFFIPSRSI